MVKQHVQANWDAGNEQESEHRAGVVQSLHKQMVISHYNHNMERVKMGKQETGINGTRATQQL